MMNPMAFLKIKPLFEQFRDRHPKFVAFLGAAPQELGEDSLLEIKIKRADGFTTKTNIRISAEDLELISQLGALAGQKE
jgi:hypothetical protein